MSEKSICRRVRRTLTAARAPRADDPDRFGIATSPECVRDHEHVSTGGSTKPQEPRLRRRVLQVRSIECLGIEEHGHGVLERDAVLRRVALAFRGSHSNTHLVYTKCTDPLDRVAGHAYRCTSSRMP